MGFIKRLIGRIPGDAEEFTLERRIINTSLFVSAVICAIVSTNSARQGFTWPYITMLGGGGIIYGFTFWLTRIKRIYTYVTPAYIGFTALWVAGMFFLYQGIEGAIGVAFVLISVLFSTMTPRKYHRYISGGLILIFIGLFITHLNFPELIMSYPSKRVWYEARMNIIIINMVFLTLIVNSLKREYEKEQAVIEEKNNALSESESNLLTAKAETDLILNNVKEGLLTINRDLQIGSQFSREVLQILELDETDLVHKPFGEIINGLNSEISVEDISSYLDIIFHACHLIQNKNFVEKEINVFVFYLKR